MNLDQLHGLGGLRRVEPRALRRNDDKVGTADGEADHQRCRAFRHLQSNVPGETIGDDDVDRSSWDILAIDVADEVDPWRVFEERVDLLDERVPL